MEVTSKVPEVQRLFKQVMADPGSMFELLRIDLKEQVEKVVNEMLKAELTAYLGRERYEPAAKSGRKNYRNGSYRRSYNAKHLGSCRSKCHASATGSFIRSFEALPAAGGELGTGHRAAVPRRVLDAIRGAGLQGAAGNSGVGRGRVEGDRRACRRHRGVAESGFERLRRKVPHRRRSELRDAHRRSVERVPMLVVIGVLRDGHKMFLAIQQGTKDAASVWREVFTDLKRRGLHAERIELGIMDGLAGAGEGVR